MVTTLKTTQVVVGTGVTVNIVASSFNAGSPNSVFALINQLQLIIVLMVIDTTIPHSVRQYIASYDFVLLDFDFVPLSRWPVFNEPVEYMDDKGPNEIQQH